nr:probable inactive receptor-like protein kinase At3g56050 [Tanacetum cinerariifolium]
YCNRAFIVVFIAIAIIAFTFTFTFTIIISIANSSTCAITISVYSTTSAFSRCSTPSVIADPSPTLSLPRSDGQRSGKKNHLSLILSIAFGGTALVGIVVLFLCRGNKVATVRPWATRLSGQLQKAFVTGVPKLKRLELEAACEDFSNVIGSTSFGTVYKRTLSSGVEIVVLLWLHLPLKSGQSILKARLGRGLTCYRR